MDNEKWFEGWSKEEQEAQMLWDYAAGMVVFYTTRRDVFRQVVKRLQGVSGVKIRESEGTIEIPMSACRKPWLAIRARKKVKI